jgi:hypothetical protein
MCLCMCVCGVKFVQGTFSAEQNVIFSVKVGRSFQRHCELICKYLTCLLVCMCVCVCMCMYVSIYVS